MKIWMMVIAAVVVLLACGRGYSEGVRSGTVTKFSCKGLAFKSWEGELLMGGVRSSANGGVESNVWAFNARDPEVVKRILEVQLAGKPVSLHYVQWVVPSPSVDSAYEVVSVAPLGETPTMAP